MEGCSDDASEICWFDLLPVEVITSILSYVHKAKWLALCVKVCRAWHDIGIYLLKDNLQLIGANLFDLTELLQLPVPYTWTNTQTQPVIVQDELHAYVFHNRRVYCHHLFDGPVWDAGITLFYSFKTILQDAARLYAVDSTGGITSYSKKNGRMLATNNYAVDNAVIVPEGRFLSATSARGSRGAVVVKRGQSLSILDSKTLKLRRVIDAQRTGLDLAFEQKLKPSYSLYSVESSESYPDRFFVVHKKVPLVIAYTIDASAPPYWLYQLIEAPPPQNRKKDAAVARSTVVAQVQMGLHHMMVKFQQVMKGPEASTRTVVVVLRLEDGSVVLGPLEDHCDNSSYFLLETCSGDQLYGLLRQQADKISLVSPAAASGRRRANRKKKNPLKCLNSETDIKTDWRASCFIGEMMLSAAIDFTTNAVYVLFESGAVCKISCKGNIDWQKKWFTYSSGFQTGELPGEPLKLIVRPPHVVVVTSLCVRALKMKNGRVQHFQSL
ncbi:hypothetical protein QOT17_018547 [Balamuthia mandrillaris]